MKWEYLHRRVSIKDLASELMQCGEERWEVAAAVVCGPGDLLCIFKRPQSQKDSK